MVTNWVDVCPRIQIYPFMFIPFCPKIMPLLRVFTHITSPCSVEDYVHLVRREIASWDGGCKTNISSLICIFGGISDYAGEQDFRLLMDTFREFLPFPTVEIAVEVDPRHMTESRWR